MRYAALPLVPFSLSSFQSFLTLLLNLQSFCLFKLTLEIQLQMRGRYSHPALKR